ncbi:MAG TPA: beta-CASP ribonuclease aCPSF1, partial [Nitrososphaera sp.]|nr:beta-CASP ribonuclease aCPSF1 [Nitrososphaera sp.]
MGELEKDEPVGEFIAQEQASAPPAKRLRVSEKPQDFDSQVTKVTTESEEAVGKLILKSIPHDSQITLVRFEGPNIALYTKNPKFALTELTYYLSSLSKTLKKRFIIRTDPLIRLPEEQTRQTVVKLLPKDILVSAVFCDDATGEVVLEVSKPEAIDPNMIVQIAQSTGWIAHTRRSPHIPSSSINIIHSTLKSSARERTDFLQ